MEYIYDCGNIHTRRAERVRAPKNSILIFVYHVYQSNRCCVDVRHSNNLGYNCYYPLSEFESGRQSRFVHATPIVDLCAECVVFIY